MNCEFCNNEFSNKQNLNAHMKKAKYCLKLQGVKGTEYICQHCNKIFNAKNDRNRHTKICKKHYDIDDMKRENKNMSDEIIGLRKENQLLREELKKSQDNYKDLSITAMSQNFEDETTIDIDDTVYQTDSDDEEIEEYKLTPLGVGQGFTIEHREDDGYINVTNLCKAGGKQFKAWKRLDKTKAFIQALSSEVLISTSGLIKLGTGGNGKSNTWVHPQVAINIAQWISPKFDVKVSGWVYEIMMTGKVNITNTTSFKKLQNDNKDQKIKIQYLTKKYVKAQPRVQYEEMNVVYILTTKLMKKERRYILGKANNLTSRLSVYNKSDEHQVVYYQGCGDEETMSLVENMVFKYLNEYREQANRERFVLPEEEDIKFFSDIINKSVEFFKK
jgi:hypothetical protein